MARRGGKAATRRSRQRKTQRPAAQPPRAPLRTEAQATTTSTSAEASAEVSSVAAPSPAVTTPAVRPAASRRAVRDPRASVGGPSRLSERAIDEYHYVARDLRNIGVLLAIMIAMLLAAFVAFNVLGVTRTG